MRTNELYRLGVSTKSMLARSGLHRPNSALKFGILWGWALIFFDYGPKLQDVIKVG